VIDEVTITDRAGSRDRAWHTGCVEFVAYERAVTPGDFYLVEAHRDLAAFATHLETDHVKRFASSLPTFSVRGPSDLIQLHELPIPV
jgi:quinol monooxygenase YgiN